MASQKHLDPLNGMPPFSQALTEDKAADGKSLVNPPRDGQSEWYTTTPTVFTQDDGQGRTNDFDFHVYYAGKTQMEHARKLHERIRREFPEIRMYKFWEIPV